MYKFILNIYICFLQIIKTFYNYNVRNLYKQYIIQVKHY